MTENSTEAQSNSSTQGLWEALAKMVESLLKAIKDLQPWAQFGAFFLVVALIATIVSTLSISSDDGKLMLIFVFFFVFSLFVLLLYALSARQNRLEGYATNLKEAANDLQEETDKRINRLESVQRQLQDVERRLKELPLSTEIEFLKNKVSALLNDISEDLEAIDGYRRNLATAREIEDRTKSLDDYKRIAAKYPGKHLTSQERTNREEIHPD